MTHFLFLFSSFPPFETAGMSPLSETCLRVTSLTILVLFFSIPPATSRHVLERGGSFPPFQMAEMRKTTKKPTKIESGSNLDFFGIQSREIFFLKKPI